jgi:hypothetical protein
MAVDDLGSWITDPTLPVTAPVPSANAAPPLPQQAGLASVSNMANFRKP